MQAEVVHPDSLDMRQLLSVLHSVRRGDFSVRMPAEYTGVAGKIADALNDIIELNSSMTAEFEKLGATVVRDGKIGHRASLPQSSGGWAACVESVNGLVADLVKPTSEAARVIGAVAKGDL